jgi:hypothetical protein
VQGLLARALLGGGPDVGVGGRDRAAIAGVVVVVSVEGRRVDVRDRRVRNARQVVVDVARASDAHEHRLVVARLDLEPHLAEILCVQHKVAGVQVHVEVLGRECTRSALELVGVGRQVPVAVLLRFAHECECADGQEAECKQAREGAGYDQCNAASVHFLFL